MEGVVAYDPVQATGDFDAIRRQHRAVKNAAWHIIKDRSPTG